VCNGIAGACKVVPRDTTTITSSTTTTIQKLGINGYDLYAEDDDGNDPDENPFGQITPIDPFDPFAEYYCDCPFPYYGSMCEQEMVVSPCDRAAEADAACFNGGVCEPARSRASKTEIPNPEDDTGPWDAITCICPFQDGVCWAGSQCATKVECFDIPDTASCSHKKSTKPQAVCSAEPPCKPAPSNQYCMPPSTDGPAKVLITADDFSPIDQVNVSTIPIDAESSTGVAPDKTSSMGIIIGVVILLLLLILLAVFLHRRKEAEESAILGRNATLRAERRTTMDANATSVTNQAYNALAVGAGGDNGYMTPVASGQQRGGAVANATYGGLDEDNAAATSSGAGHLAVGQGAARGGAVTNATYGGVGPDEEHVNASGSVYDAATLAAVESDAQSFNDGFGDGVAQPVPAYQPILQAGEYLYDQATDSTAGFGGGMAMYDAASGGSAIGGGGHAALYDAASGDGNASPRNRIATVWSGSSAAVYDQAGGGENASPCDRTATAWSGSSAAMYDQAEGGGGALYDQAGDGGGALYDQASGGSMNGAATYAEGRNGIVAANTTYDMASAVPSTHTFDQRRLSAWLAYAGRPVADTNFDRAATAALLHGSNIGPGAFCFRPSSKGGGGMVLCVKIDDTRISNMRIEPVRGTAVNVLDLAPLPIEFPSVDHALAHFADLNNQPNNSIALVESASLPANTKAVRGGIKRGAKRGSVYEGFGGVGDADLDC
jgi:hypothetical protein